MRDRKHEMVEEYELLYEKYQQVITAEWLLCFKSVL